jgi:hypothetical protein
MPQSLVNAIYDRYSEISSSDLEAPIATAPILADNRSCTNMCTVNCSDYLSSSSSSSSFPSPGSSSSQSSSSPPQLNNSNEVNLSSGISFYIPPAYSPRKTRNLFNFF